MNRSLLSALTLTTLTFSALPLLGCRIEGSAETGVRYEGTTVSKDVPYTKGQGVKIVGDNGNIDVRAGGSSSLSASFTPFTMDTDEKEDRAKREMEEQLSLSVSIEGNTIVVNADRLSGGSSALGADIVVTMPAGFEGDFTIRQNNGFIDADLTGGTPLSTNIVNDGAGDIDVRGAAGRLTIQGDFDVSVDVASWSAESGYVRAGDGLGDLVFRLPADVNGKMTAVADEQIIESDPIPASWAVDATDPDRSKSYTMGTGEGGQVDLSAGETITIDLK